MMLQFCHRTAIALTATLFVALSASCGGGGTNSHNHTTHVAGANPLIPPNEQVVKDYLGESALELLRGQSSWELFALNKEPWINWHRDDDSANLLGEANERLADIEFSLGSFKLEAPAERNRFLTNLYEAIGDGTISRDCFYPTYALKVFDEDREIIILFCSMCGCIAVLDTEATKIKRRPIPEFKEFHDYLDTLLREHDVPSGR